MDQRTQESLYAIKGDVRDMIFGGSRRARAQALKYTPQPGEAVQFPTEEDECEPLVNLPRRRPHLKTIRLCIPKRLRRKPAPGGTGPYSAKIMCRPFQYILM